MSMLRRAEPSDLERLLAMVEAFHQTAGIDLPPEARNASVSKLLQSPDLGAIYMIGPTQAPVGYIALTFGFSIEMGGRDAFIDELFIRERVRRKGLGSQVMAALPALMQEHDILALHLEVDRTNDQALRLYQRARFAMRDNYNLMTLMR